MNDNDNPAIEPEVEELPEFMKEAYRLSVIRTLQPEEVKERSLHLLNGTIVCGLMVGELHDSFLVALASTLSRDEAGRIKANFISKSRVVRVFKASVAMIGFMSRELRKGYFEHLLSLRDLLPDILTEVRCAVMKEILYTDESESESEPESLPKRDGKPSVKSMSNTGFDSVSDYMADYSILRH